MSFTKHEILEQIDIKDSVALSPAKRSRLSISAYLNYHNLMKCLYFLKKKSPYADDDTRYYANIVVIMIAKGKIQIRANSVKELRSKIALNTESSNFITLEFPNDFSYNLTKNPIYCLSQLVQSIFCIKEYLKYYYKNLTLDQWYNNNTTTLVLSIDKQIQFLSNACMLAPAYSHFEKINTLQSVKNGYVSGEIQ